MQARVICHTENKSPINPYVAQCKERICGDIQADVLLRTKGSRPGKTCARCHLCRNLFI